MTQKQLIKFAKNIASKYDNNFRVGRENAQNDIEDLLMQFFEQNICIPKGENRHPYADELHKLAEDQNSVEFKISEFTKFTNDTSILEFRIKPSEPVYEWQWITFRNGYAEILNELGKNGLHQFFITDEVDLKVWKKIEETKRERKQ